MWSGNWNNSMHSLRQLQFPQENITRPIVYLNTEKTDKASADCVYPLDCFQDPNDDHDMSAVVETGNRRLSAHYHTKQKAGVLWPQFSDQVQVACYDWGVIFTDGSHAKRRLDRLIATFKTIGCCKSCKSQHSRTTNQQFLFIEAHLSLHRLSKLTDVVHEHRLFPRTK